MADIFTATGAKLFIGTAVTDTPANAAAYAALTFTEVGVIESLGEFGDEAAVVTFASLGDGRVRKAKGARDAGTLTVTVGYVPDDDGQLACFAAELTNSNYAFKVELPNKITLPGGANELRYFKAIVNAARTNVGANDNVVRLNIGLAVNSAILTVAPT